MHLSIIIVNWNSKAFLEKCISSIKSDKRNIDCEIIVIDSGSFDGSCEIIKQLHPEVKFIQSERNLGFAKANNTAFMESLKPNILFLNPDTEIINGALEALLKNLNTLPNAGAVGAQLLNNNGSVQSTCIRAFPTILNQILDAERLRKIFPYSKLYGTAPLYNNVRNPAKVDAVSGACIMIKRSAFAEVGMFSTDYFMYSEDIDLCYKLNRAGWNTYYIPVARVIHHGGASTSKSHINRFSDVMMLESRFRYFRKTRSSTYGRLYQLSMFFISIIRISLFVLIWFSFAYTKKTDYVKRGMLKWISRLRWTLGLESWIKDYIG